MFRAKTVQMDEQLNGRAWSAFGWIIRLYLNLWQRNDRFLAEYGLSSHRYGALMFVHQVGTISHTELAKIMSVHPSTMTRIIDELEAKGLVERQPRGQQSDRRESLIAVTAKGESLLDQVDTTKQHLHLALSLRRVFASDEEIDAFIAKLAALSADVTDLESSEQYGQLMSAFIEARHPLKPTARPSEELLTLKRS